MTHRAFVIDPRLLADAHYLGSLSGAELLLHRDAGLPWFILVPVTDRLQFFELEAGAREGVLELARRLAGFIADVMEHPKINLATLGNVVEQLHLHVIGRSAGDPCWPKPVWGNLATSLRYSDERLEMLRSDLGSLLRLRRPGG